MSQTGNITIKNKDLGVAFTDKAISKKQAAENGVTVKMHEWFMVTNSITGTQSKT